MSRGELTTGAVCERVGRAGDGFLGADLDGPSNEVT